MKPSYQFSTITSRTTLPNGNAATGPAFTEMITSMLPGSTPLPAVLGAYAEDFEFVSGSGDLDVHNGRFCKTPEYPNGIFCYFSTIDSLNNPVYPYIIGDTYYGVAPMMGPGNSFTNSTIPSGLTVYNPTTAIKEINDESLEVNAYTSTDKEVLVIQSNNSQSFDRTVDLINLSGQIVQTNLLFQGSTMCYFDLRTVYNGVYLVRVSSGNKAVVKKVFVQHN